MHHTHNALGFQHVNMTPPPPLFSKLTTRPHRRTESQQNDIKNNRMRDAEKICRLMEENKRNNKNINSYHFFWGGAGGYSRGEEHLGQYGSIVQ